MIRLAGLCEIIEDATDADRGDGGEIGGTGRENRRSTLMRNCLTLLWRHDEVLEAIRVVALNALETGVDVRPYTHEPPNRPGALRAEQVERRSRVDRALVQREFCRVVRDRAHDAGRLGEDIGLQRKRTAVGERGFAVRVVRHDVFRDNLHLLFADLMESADMPKRVSDA
jgi:hypothetical protein